MKYLGIDYGSKRVGLAVSDERASIAFPLEVVVTHAALSRIKEIVAEKRIGAIVMGDTRGSGGVGNEVTGEAEHFADDLEREVGLPVSRAVELWSSIEASRYAGKGNEHRDESAAAIILQRFLEMHGPEKK